MSGMADLARLAMSMCRNCGLKGAAVGDVADRILLRARRRPRGRRFGCLVYSLRTELRRELGLPGKMIPRRWTALQAVGQYESDRLAYAGLRGRSWPRAFDHHSRRFAIENGVCPRCASPGQFSEGGGECPCGFAYAT
jgi:hypothetical protein